MHPIITAFPAPNFRSLREKKGLFANGLRSYTALFGSGTAAVYWAFRGSGLPKGSTAWMPSFNCGVEIQAAMDAGFTVRYYRVAPDLSVDVEDLERRLRNCPGAVLLIHYFGFPQTRVEMISQLCRELGSVLIEDCAHALFSSLGGTPLGSFGDASVYSLRKSLPLYDGGALQINRSEFKITPRLKRATVPFKVFVKDSIRRTADSRLMGAFRRWLASGRKGPPKAPWETQAPCYSKGFSLLSRRLALSASPDDIVSARRRRWQRVHGRLSGLKEHHAVWDHLPDGVSPLFYCVRVRDRDILMNRLLASGVETFRFGAQFHPTLDLSLYPGNLEMRESILAFPVHQDLDPNSLNEALDIYCRSIE